MADMPRPCQLALSLDHDESFAREDFLEAACNVGALAMVDRWPDWVDRVMALVGPEGSGKSHLAAIWAVKARARVVSAPALREPDLPDLLAQGALALEDLPGDVAEHALFHLLNLVREERAFLLVTTRTAPAGWPIRLPDLRSRLRAIPVTMLEAPDDALLRGLLIKLFADRQLAVDESLIAYLVSRIERSFAAARRIVDELDREALRRQRPVTRALAAEMLGSPGDES
jgi:chromosomal replication initiation ATPase DnaA